MKQPLRKYMLPFIFAAFCQSVGASGLKVSGLAPGMAELDLFSASAGGSYVKSVEASTLQFPLTIVEDRNGGYVIRYEGEKFYVGAADVITNKEYQVTASCNNEFAVNVRAASRGIAGKGC